MAITTVLTGLLPAVIVLAALFAGVASLGLLWLYRRAVARGMKSGDAVPPTTLTTEQPPPGDLTIEHLEVTQAEQIGGAIPQAVSRSRRRLATAYLVAGIAYAVVMSTPWMITAGDGFLPVRAMWFLVVFSWPTLLTMLLVYADTRRQALRLLCEYLLLLALVAVPALALSPDLTPGQLVYLWCFANLPSSLLLGIVLYRPLRAISPLVMAFAVLAFSGAALLVTLAGGTDSFLRLLVSLAEPLGLGAVSVFIGLHLTGFLLLGWLGWLLLQRLGRAYEDKRFSARALTVDAVWMLFAVLHCFTLSFEGWAWVFTGIVAYMAYLFVFRFMCKRLALSRSAHGVLSLLLLRVFALGGRSRSLYDQLTARWLRVGYIDLIAGPDLATATVETDEILTFSAGEMDSLFLDNNEVLGESLARRDRAADPDGQFRVNELFCRNHIWRAAVERLAREDDVVLMDLRSFSEQHGGCRWELQQLLSIVPLRRVLLLVDASTDIKYLEQTLLTLWQKVPTESPNARGACIRILHAEHEVSAAAEQAVALLGAIASGDKGGA
jgi:hypothetical protein